MLKFIAGLMVGLFTGLAASAGAADLVGDDDYAVGWDVTINGHVVCSDPFIWVSTQEIECD